MKFPLITQLALTGKRIFIRTDMNVPLNDNGMISDDTRIRAGVTTIRYVLSQGGKIILATHLGRPNEGKCTQYDSVKVIITRLEQILQQKVGLLDSLDKVPNFNEYNICMLENVRCNVGEHNNNKELAMQYAKLCDIFVHDAFATAHRKEASTDAIANYVPLVCAGLLMQQELEAINSALYNAKSPLIAIVSGAKVSTKLSILNNLMNKVDYLIVGGGILNTFLLAQGVNIGKSLAEPNLVTQAKNIFAQLQQRGAKMLLPQTVLTAKHFCADAPAQTKDIQNLEDDDMILDVGESFSNSIKQIIQSANTIIWNGPIGVFEFPQFSRGTLALAKNITDNKNAFSLVGGGDTIAALNQFGLYDKISYVSTAGGALLELLGGKNLPAIELLNTRNNDYNG
jgi:phosphoglycerate kinase